MGRFISLRPALVLSLDHLDGYLPDRAFMLDREQHRITSEVPRLLNQGARKLLCASSF
jgi:hypothetical protein